MDISTGWWALPLQNATASYPATIGKTRKLVLSVLPKSHKYYSTLETCGAKRYCGLAACFRCMYQHSLKFAAKNEDMFFISEFVTLIPKVGSRDLKNNSLKVLQEQAKTILAGIKWIGGYDVSWENGLWQPHLHLLAVASKKELKERLYQLGSVVACRPLYVTTTTSPSSCLRYSSRVRFYDKRKKPYDKIVLQELVNHLCTIPAGSLVFGSEQ